MDHKDYLQYMINYIIAYKIGYMALFVSSLPDDMDDASIDIEAIKYLAMVIQSGRSSLLEERTINSSLDSNPYDEASSDPEDALFLANRGWRKVVKRSGFVVEGGAETTHREQECDYDGTEGKSFQELDARNSSCSDKGRKRVRVVPVGSHFGTAQTASWQKDPAFLAAESDEHADVLQTLKGSQLSCRDFVVFMLHLFHEEAPKYFLSAHWEYLEKTTQLSRDELENRIHEAAAMHPGREVHSISADFIATLLSISKANVYKIVSRVKENLPDRFKDMT